MNSRERVILALNHQKPDKVPVDLGATAVSGISVWALDKLRKALKLDNKIVKVQEPLQMLGYVENDIMDALSIDVIGLWSLETNFGYKNSDWKHWRLFDGTEVLVGHDFTVKENANGSIFIYPQGDINVAPSGILPKGGFYFDNLTRQEFVDEDLLNGRKDFKEQFILYTDDDIRHLENAVNKLYKDTNYAIIGQGLNHRYQRLIFQLQFYPCFFPTLAHLISSIRQEIFHLLEI